MAFEVGDTISDDEFEAYGIGTTLSDDEFEAAYQGVVSNAPAPIQAPVAQKPSFQLNSSGGASGAWEPEVADPRAKAQFYSPESLRKAEIARANPDLFPEAGYLEILQAAPIKAAAHINNMVGGGVDFIEDTLGTNTYVGKKMRARGEGVLAEANAYLNLDESLPKQIASDASTAVLEMVPLAMAAPGAVVGAATLGTGAAFDKFSELRDAGVSYAKSTGLAAAFGGISTATEKLPLGTIFKKTGKGVLPALKKAVVVAGQEGFEEGVQEVVDIGIDYAGKGDLPTLEEGAKRVAYASTVGAVAGGALGGVSTIKTPGAQIDQSVDQATPQEATAPSKEVEIDNSKEFPDIPTSQSDIVKIESQPDSSEIDVSQKPIVTEAAQVPDAFIRSEDAEQTSKATEIEQSENLLEEPSTKDTIKKWLRLNATSRGGLPEKMFDSKLRNESLQNTIKKDMEFRASDFKLAVRKAAKESGIQESQLSEFANKAMNGEARIEELPEVMQVPVRQMRAHVDQLSTRLIEEGVVQGELAPQGEVDIEKVVAREFTRKLKKLDTEIRKAAVRLKARNVNITKADLNAKVEEVIFNTGDIKSLPEEVRFAVTKIKQYTERVPNRVIIRSDPNSGELVVDTAVFSDPRFSDGFKSDIAAIIEQNKGTYLNRSYKIFETPIERYKKTIPQSVVNRAVGLLRKQNPIQKGESSSSYESRIQAILESTLYNAGSSPMEFLEKSSLSKRSMKILTGRKDIPPEIRALWGEKTDALDNYATTVSKQANLLASHKFLTEIAEAGNGTYFFKKEQPGFAKQISSEGNKALKPLDGKFTSPEMHEVLTNLYKTENNSWVTSQLMALNGISKWGKTVGNPSTQARNFEANILYAVANGNVNLAALRGAGKASKLYMRDILPSGITNSLGKDPKARTQQWRNAYLKYTRLGLIDDTITAKELQAVFDESLQEGSTLKNFANSKIARKPVKGLKAVTGFANKLYQAGDGFWKVVNFESEISKYRKAYQDAGVLKSEAELEEQAARIVRDTTPSYSLVPEVIQKLRRVPFIAPFTAFTSEVIRNNYNIAKLAKAEIADPVLRSIGMKRAAGLVTAHSLPMAVASVYKLFSAVDDKDEQAMRELVAPWDKNANLVPLPRDEKGNMRYVNASYTDPFAIFKNGAIGFLQNKDESLSDAILTGAGELLEPFIMPEIFAASAIDIARNKTAQGNSIWLDNDSIEAKIQKGFVHIAKALEPGVSTTARRFSMHGKQSRGGKVYNAKDELTALAGMRVNTIDPKIVMGFKMKDFHRANSESTRIFSYPVRNPNPMSDQEVLDSLRATIEAKDKVYSEFKKQIAASIHLGLKDDDLKLIAKDVGLSAKRLGAVLKGQQIPYQVSDALWKQINKIPGRRQQVIQALKLVASERQANLVGSE